MDPSLAPEEIPSTPDSTNTNGAYVVDVTAQVGCVSKHILLEGVHISLSSNRHEIGNNILKWCVVGVLPR